MQNKVASYIFSSGFSIIVYTTYSLGTHTQIILLDVNALKGPNKWGHDIFSLMFNKKSRLDSVFKIEPHDSCFAPQKGGYYTKTFMEYLYGQNAEL